MTEFKGFKFEAKLVLVFAKTESNDSTIYNIFCSNPKAETVINESDIDNVFESIYTTIISNM